MARSGFKPGVIDQFEKDVIAAASIADAFITEEQSNQKVIRALIESAMAGVGPEGKKYPPYKTDGYEARKKKEGGSSRFLWGLRRTGLHMLNRVHFTWKKISDFAVELIWQGTGKTGDYAKVHNEGLGKQPKREWMHLDAPLTRKAIDILRRGILKNNADKFTRKYGR